MRTGNNLLKQIYVYSYIEYTMRLICQVKYYRVTASFQNQITFEVF